MSEVSSRPRRGPSIRVESLVSAAKFLRRPTVIAAHLVLIPLGYWAAYAIRFDLSIPASMQVVLLATLPWVLGIRFAIFAVAGLFQGWWRHVGMRDLTMLVKAVSASSALFIGLLFFVPSLNGVPRSVLLLDWLIAITLFGGARFAVRASREHRITWVKGRHGRPTLVIGAGAAAERLLRELQRDPSSELLPVGLVDDDASKGGMRIHGVPVLGGTSAIPTLTDRLGVQLLVIAIPSASRAEMRRIIEPCIATGVDFKIVPSLRELLDGRMRLSQLRSVEIEDLLGRDVVSLEETQEGWIDGRTVLVTGAAGSIGSELVRQLAALGPQHIVLVDQAESPLYFTHLGLSSRHPKLKVTPIIADVADERRLEAVFQKHRPHVVFHAAAYKHVPLMEENPQEAVRNNVFGTLAVAECAARAGVSTFVLISTDKAVHPSSVMGGTKRIAEQLVLGWPALRESGTDFRAVRFGNVLGSDGSVIPLFRRQLAAGEPLTVTHPDVTRYFMTIPEAVQLVLQAAALPQAAGRICMLEMGEPVRITDLAENLVRLSGLEPYRDVPIVFTGLRPGEKLHEELMSELEATVPTAVEKILIVQTSEPDSGALQSGLDALASSLALGLDDDLLRGVRALVPECVPPLRARDLQRAPAGG
jgi:FlaA1/EpsC-like NDP-sugar epimerase